MKQCIIMLQHRMMTVIEWHDKGPQDLVALSLSILGDQSTKPTGRINDGGIPPR